MKTIFWHILMKTETWSKYVSEYRRFISYIYEYQRGRKQGNCGYAKVEIRGGVFRLRMHLQPVGKDAAELQVYGFVRRRGSIYGILLGSVGLKNRAYDFQTTSQAAHIGGSSYTAGELRGIWLRGEGENYITVWDDEPVAVEQFTDREPEESAPVEAGGPEAVLSDNAAAQENAVRKGGAAAQENAVRKDGASARDNTVRKDSAAEQENTVQTDSAAAQENAVQVIQAQSMPGAVRRQQAQPGTLAARWQNFLQHYPQIYPFADEEITQCISIAPKDLSFLPREEWQYGKNTFLRQAYAQYHHLMLGCHACGRFVLAVPGNFRDMQEKHLARMYGFPYYKETAAQTGQEELCAADMGNTEPEGYWYHFLNEICP